MDSTNCSGSIQSSSSGDDYYEYSQAEAISSSLNLPPQPPPSSSHHLKHQPSPSSSVSLSPHVNPFPFSPPDPNPLNLDMTWVTSFPSSSLENSCTITTASSSSKAMAVAAVGRSPPSGSSRLNPSVQLPTQPSQPTTTTRGSKKRSRASRRAPTTVLATDRSNFRAMVQEFTGFPTAPFISSPFPRPRLDLFPAATTAPTYYPFGSLAQKLQAPLFAPISSPSSSSIAHVAAYLSRNSVASANARAASTRSDPNSSSVISSGNYNLRSTVLQHPNLLNMQSPDFTFQSSLQPSQAPPYHNSSTTLDFEANPPLGPSDLGPSSPWKA